MLDPQSVAQALTVPETPKTLGAQQEQLVQGGRDVQMFPLGAPELPLPPGFQRLVTPKGIFHFNPKVISPQEIMMAVETGRENEILNLGPVSKQDVAERTQQGEKPVSVTERQPDGTEVRASTATDKTAPMQMAAMQPQATPGNQMGVEDPQTTILLRLLSQQ